MTDEELLFIKAINGTSGTWHEKFLAALNALTAAGWQRVGPDQVVVPREATPEMCEQFYALRLREQSLAVSASDSYRAMLAALPPKG